MGILPPTFAYDQLVVEVSIPHHLLSHVVNPAPPERITCNLLYRVQRHLVWEPLLCHLEELLQIPIKVFIKFNPVLTYLPIWISAGTVAVCLRRIEFPLSLVVGNKGHPVTCHGVRDFT